MELPTDKPFTRVAALDHLDEQGSIVKSGIRLARAVIANLGGNGNVLVDLRGLRGASSSYFNVFLGEVQETCGLAGLDRNILIEFANGIQRTTYERSLVAIEKGPRSSTEVIVASSKESE